MTNFPNKDLNCPGFSVNWETNPLLIHFGHRWPFSFSENDFSEPATCSTKVNIIGLTCNLTGRNHQINTVCKQQHLMKKEQNIADPQRNQLFKKKCQLSSSSYILIWCEFCSCCCAHPFCLPFLRNSIPINSIQRTAKSKCKSCKAINEKHCYCLIL